MLTTEAIDNNKIKFLELLGTAGIDLTKISKYLLKVDYFNKPYTAQYNGAYDGGLCEHALKLYEELTKLCNFYVPNKYTNITLIKVALMHDLYRAELYEAYNKNVKNDLTGQWESTRAYKTKEERPTFGDIGFSSYMIAKYFMSFNDEEIEAIVNSGSLTNFSIDIHDIMKDYPLVTLIRMADMVVNYLGKTLYEF